MINNVIMYKPVKRFIVAIPNAPKNLKAKGLDNCLPKELREVLKEELPKLKFAVAGGSLPPNPPRDVDDFMKLKLSKKISVFIDNNLHITDKFIKYDNNKKSKYFN